MSDAAARPATDAWLEVAENRETWTRISDGIALVAGFELLIAVVPDLDSERLLRELVVARARELERSALILDARDEGPQAPARRLLELEIERPLVVLETLAASREGAAVLERCFTQLNPRRDQIRARVDGPVVVILRPDGLRRFIDAAPDLHSVHAAQVRFANSRPPPSPPKWLLTPREVGGLLGLPDALTLADQDQVPKLCDRAPMMTAKGDVDEVRRDELVAAIEVADRRYSLPRFEDAELGRATLVQATRRLAERGWTLIWLRKPALFSPVYLYSAVVRELSKPEESPPLDLRDAKARYLELTAETRALLVFEVEGHAVQIPWPAPPSCAVVTFPKPDPLKTAPKLRRISEPARSIFAFCREWSEVSARIPSDRLAHVFAGEDLAVALDELTRAELVELEGECVQLRDWSARRTDTRFLRPYLRSRGAVEINADCDDFEARALNWAARLLAPKYWIEFDDGLIDAAAASLAPSRRAGFYAALALEVQDDEARGLRLHQRAIQAALDAYADPFEHLDESWRHLHEGAPEAFFRLRVLALLSQPDWLVDAVDAALAEWVRVEASGRTKRHSLAASLERELRELAPRFGSADPGAALVDALRGSDHGGTDALTGQLDGRVDTIILRHMSACAESWARIHLGPREPARASVERATQSARAWGSPFALFRGRMLEFVMLTETGDLDRAGEQVDDLVERAEQLFGPIHPASADVLARSSRVLAETGETEHAIEHADRCWSALTQLEVQLPEICQPLADVYAAGGREDRSEALRRQSQTSPS